MSEKITVEEELRRVNAALREALDENHILRQRCSQLSEAVSLLRVQVCDQQAAITAQVRGTRGVKSRKLPEITNRSFLMQAKIKSLSTHRIKY